MEITKKKIIYQNVIQIKVEMLLIPQISNKWITSHLHLKKYK